MPTETPVIVNQEYLEDIADAIRAKNGTIQTYTPADMAQAIADLPTGSSGYALGDIESETSRTYYSSGSTWSSPTLVWKGDIRKISYIIFGGCISSNSSTFNDYYIFLPWLLSQNPISYGQNTLLPIIKLRTGSASGNSYAQIYLPSSNSYDACVLYDKFTVSFGGKDTTQYSAVVFGYNQQSLGYRYNCQGYWARMDITI